MHKDYTPALPNPDTHPTDWIDYAACATADFSFDGFPAVKRLEDALQIKTVRTAAKICAGCVVRSQCGDELNATFRADRNEGSVQAGKFIGKNGGLFNLL